MERAGLTYIAATDLWKDQEGNTYLRNRFRADQDIFVLLGQDEWSTFYSGERRLVTWKRPALDPAVLALLQDEFREQLKRKSVHALNHLQVFLGHLEKAQAAGITIDSALFHDTQRNIDLWAKLPSVMRILWRTALQNRVDAGDKRVSESSLYGISKARSRTNVQTLRSVLEWNAEDGALTTAELELLRQALPESLAGLSNKDALAVLLLRTFLATLRRTQQIIQVKKDGHKIVAVEGVGAPQHFLDIPKAKGQAHEESEWEAIPKTLGALIDAYSARPDVLALQQSSGYLYVLPPKHGREATAGNHYGLSSNNSKEIIHDWVKKANIVSPRTGKTMKVSMNRLRHTGATQMARQGQPRQVIQDMLQHDSPASASAYIDAVASDLVPLFERADRQLGGVFDELQRAFFKGKVIPQPARAEAPVVVPDLGTLAVVGSCSKQGVCSLNPLFSCYSGCPHFLAFKEADHTQTYRFVEETYKRWQGAEHSPERSKSIKDFERVLKGIKEVIDIVGEAH